MPLMFNMLLEDAGISPSDVRLLRHQTGKVPGRSPYTLWRDDVTAFEQYQSTQDPAKRARFDARYWASFVSPPGGGTLFVGLYEIDHVGAVANDAIDPLTGLAPGADKGGGQYDQYRCDRSDLLSDYIGRLHVSWGVGSSHRAWVQRADRQNKEIIELAREFREEAFPGFTAFSLPLSDLPGVPIGWRAALGAARGVYLLACPRTREHYVGSADGADGFFGRWMDYVATGHGGNAGMRIRDPSDYLVSVLEVAGSTAGRSDILAMEEAWKRKLVSRSIGLNRN